MPVVINGSGTITPTSAVQPTGSILQVVQTIKKDTFSFTTTSGSVGEVSGDVTGLGVTITPSSASNKILLIANVSMCNQARVAYLYKDGSLMTGAIGDAANDGNGNALLRASMGVYSSSINNSNVNSQYLDTAGGTSAITYTIRIGPTWAGSAVKTIYVNRCQDADEVYNNYRLARYMSTFTAMEIAV
tara:strand:+ start:37 stop:600 length:564 start_codon:yes stop_codon:yes gene_type:complete